MPGVVPGVWTHVMLCQPGARPETDFKRQLSLTKLHGMLLERTSLPALSSGCDCPAGPEALSARLRGLGIIAEYLGISGPQ